MFAARREGETMKFKIINTEICDNAYKNEHDIFPVSGISVRVDIKIKNKEYGLDFQTSGSLDYGAISSDLRAYDGHDDYDKLADLFNDPGCDQFLKLLDEIEKEAGVQKKWTEYINKKYIVNGGYYGGMDANSEIDEMVLRENYQDKLDEFNGDTDQLFEFIKNKDNE